MSDPQAGWGGLPPDAGGGARQVAYFISTHGFGHATRACAVMAALLARDPQLHFHIFTQVPEWVFAGSLPGGYTYHDAPTDVGLVQHTAWVEDLPATLQRLDDFLPFDPFLVSHWSAWLGQMRCEFVICDIAPLGLAVAQAAGLPSVLIENFTWDWIYAGYLEQAPEFARHLDALRAAFALATYHLQADPVCAPTPTADRRLPPISRQPRAPRAATRAGLGIDEASAMVLVTLGGVPGPEPLPLPTAGPENAVYVLPGARAELERAGNCVRLPQRSDFYHPDLVHASDVVIGKAGYSTVAEAFQAGVPFGYVPRPDFRESTVMADFIERQQMGQVLPLAALQSGAWGDHVAGLLAQPPRRPAARNGADEAAVFILERL
jgi:hypothetical protein